MIYFEAFCARKTTLIPLKPEQGVTLPSVPASVDRKLSRLLRRVISLQSDVLEQGVI